MDGDLDGLEGLLAQLDDAERVEAEPPPLEVESEPPAKRKYAEANVVEQRPFMKTSEHDPAFIANYHSHSRLHHLATWGVVSLHFRISRLIPAGAECKEWARRISEAATTESRPRPSHTVIVHLGSGCYFLRPACHTQQTWMHSSSA